MPLRPYQQDAVNAAIDFMRKSERPCLIDAPTGAGKSHIIAALAEWLKQKSNDKVLVLQPNVKLLRQNREKFLATGMAASVYSASAGKKCLKHDVIFATPLSLKKAIKTLKAGAIIVDEAHGVTPTFKKIYEALKEKNPYMRVCGLTATPYRLGQGYIYELDNDGDPVEQTKDPFFYKMVYRISAHELIQNGYLTPPAIGESESGYLTTTIINDQKELDKAVIGQGRKTSRICADIVKLTQGREGVMIFAASIDHANEIAQSMPEALTGVITGGQSKENDKILKQFENKRLKYLVNVDMLTTGYDAAHIDCIALLRATESAALLQQMIGRGLRLNEGKLDCLVLDYAENIERHAPDGDIFNPEIKASKRKTPNFIKAECPECNHENVFSLNAEATQGLKIDKNGYVVDLAGQRVMTEYGPQPAHYGRRCNGIILPLGDRCSYRWTYKTCDECEHENDIAARKCASCKVEIVNPNDKLKEEFIKRKRDPGALSTDVVKSWQVKKSISKAGNKMLVATFYTEYNTVTVFLPIEGNYTKPADRFMAASKNITEMPRTITYYKSGKYWTITAYNEPEDEI